MGTRLTIINTTQGKPVALTVCKRKTQAGVCSEEFKCTQYFRLNIGIYPVDSDIPGLVSDNYKQTCFSKKGFEMNLLQIKKIEVNGNGVESNGRLKGLKMD